MANRGLHLLQLLLWIIFFRAVESKDKDCGPRCTERESSVIFISVIVTLICLVSILGAIFIVWCCCCRNGGRLMQKISRSTPADRSAFVSEYNTRTAVLSTRPADDIENHIIPSIQTEVPSPEEPTQTDIGPPSYEEVMNKYEGQSSPAASSV